MSSSKPITPRETKIIIPKLNMKERNTQTPLMKRNYQQPFPVSPRTLEQNQTNEELLTTLLFEEESKLLFTYCQTLNQINQFNSHSIKVLFKYFKSRGKLNELLINLGRNEITKTNINNELFRGNNIFTKVYNEYTKLYCNDYLNKIINPILNKIKELKINEFSLYHSTQSMNRRNEVNSNSNSISEEQMNEILKICIQQFKENPFPVDLQYVFRILYFYTLGYRDEKEAKKYVRNINFLTIFITTIISISTYIEKNTTIIKISKWRFNGSV